MSPAELTGAIRMLEAILEIAAESGEETVSVVDIEELLEKYRKRVIKKPQ